MAANAESEITALFERTRVHNLRYSSARYREEGQGENGLGNRLEALEEALLILARRVDMLAGDDGVNSG
jgi:hypothetical protein